MSDNLLPAEIWTRIFDYAADEDVIFQYGLPTVMAESAWFKSIFGEWTLRTPQEALNLLQRRSYATKKTIMSTCRFWNHIGPEFLFRCLFFDNPAKLTHLATTLATSIDPSKSPCWWTKRFHLTRYYVPKSQSHNDIETALTSIISHCPNLEIFIIDWPLPSVYAFSVIANALATHTFSTLRTIHWNVPALTLPKVIWALDSLPYILVAQIEFSAPAEGDASYPELDDHLGAASDIHLHLPHLQQLSLRGHTAPFVEQALGWSIPALKVFELDCGTSRTDQPDVFAFLTAHGTELLFLSISCIPPLDVPKILDVCPMLTTFSFNADWRMGPSAQTQDGTGVGAGLAMNDASMLVNRPHPNIRTIGLHGLMYAFGVGYAATYSTVDPLRSRIIRRTNDLNVFAIRKKSFPRLERVRCLSRPLLMDLSKNDGPSQEEGGMERWERWWGHFADMGVRMEDCTGAELGVLPVDEDESDEEEDDDDDDDEEEWLFDIPPPPEEEGPRNPELRELLEECRIMNAGREEGMFSSMMTEYRDFYGEGEFEYDDEHYGEDEYDVEDGNPQDA